MAIVTVERRAYCYKDMKPAVEYFLLLFEIFERKMEIWK